MGGLCHRARNIEVENGLRPGPYFSDAPPPGVSTSSCTIATKAIAHEINVGVLVIRRPMPLKIVEKCWPIVRQAVLVEIPQGKRKAMVNPNHGWLLF
jgi:hypothetical protein